MGTNDQQTFDARQRALEKDVSNTAKASVLHLDLLVAIERHLRSISWALWVCAIFLAMVIFARN
jgi:hypothetical protein